MSFFLKPIRQAALAVAKQRGIPLTNGMSFGQLGVYNAQSDSIEDPANPMDPAQRAQWAGATVDRLGSSVQRQQDIAQQYRDVNSAQNQTSRDFYQKLFLKSAPTTNSLLGAMIGSGLSMGTGAYLAEEKNKQYQEKSRDEASDAWTKEYLSEQAIGADYERVGEGYESLRTNYLAGQDEMAFKSDMARRESSDSFLNQMIGLGGGLLGKYLTGGFL
jgi:hypothetical protein